MKYLFIILFSLIVLSQPLYAAPQKPLEVVIFTGAGCPHCAKMLSYLETLKNQYLLEVKEFEIYHSTDNQYEFLKYAKVFNFQANGVPITIIGNQIINGENYSSLVSAIETCQTNYCQPPSQIVENYYVSHELPAKPNQTNTTTTTNNAVVWGILLVVIVLAGGTGIYLGKKH